MPVERLTAKQAYARALALHRQRRLGEAEQLYQGILRLEPGHAGALHNLGAIRTQQGRPEEATQLIGRAIELDANSAEAHNDLGMALVALHRFAEAADHYQRALVLRPEMLEARGNLANALIALHRSDEAVVHLQQAIAARPGSAELYNNLGNAFSSLNRHEDAIAQYRKALAIRPNFPEVHNNLAFALNALGRPGQAMAHFEQAIALKPDYVDALRNIGKALLERNRAEQALPYMSRVVALSPDADAHNDMGNALSTLERHHEAIAHYENALAKNPRFPAAHNNLGNALSTIGRHEEALAQLNAALAITPDYPEALSNKGNTLLILRRPHEAISCFERALAIRPNMAQALNGLGGALQSLGRLAESRTIFEKAVALAPRKGGYYHGLSIVKRFAPADPHLLAMEALAREAETLAPEDRICLHFALGKAYDDIGEHARAFQQYSEANAQQRARIAYDEALTLAGFGRLRAVFTADLLRSRQGSGDPSEVPTFILGMPRSGTTLVEQILASHPRVFGAGELRDMGLLADALRRPDGSRGFPEVVPAMNEEQLRAFGARYVSRVAPLAPSAARITDKMPGNFYFVGLIRIALPNARIVHVRRDPLDTCVSCFIHRFMGELVWTHDLGEIGRTYRAYASLMEHWRSILPEGAMLEVQYEELVADFERQARRLIDYCGLPWDDRCLSFHRTERPVWTASLAQVRQPIYASAIGRARAYLPMLGPLLKELEQDPRGS